MQHFYTTELLAAHKQEYNRMVTTMPNEEKNMLNFINKIALSFDDGKRFINNDDKKRKKNTKINTIKIINTSSL